MICPLCESPENSPIRILTQEKGKSRKSAILLKCRKCGLLFAEDCASDRSRLYDESYWVWDVESGEAEKMIGETKKTAFAGQLGSLKKHINPEGKKILDVGTGFGYLLEVANELGFDCHGIDISGKAVEMSSRKFSGKIVKGNLISADYPNGYFDVVSMVDVLEHIADPRETIAEAQRILKPGGLLFIISPNSSSITRLLSGKNWFQYKYEHILFFNKKSLKFLLEKYSFELLEFKLNRKRFNLAYYEAYFRKYSFFGLEMILSLFFPLLPNFAKKKYFSNPLTGEFLAIAKKV
jgi:2-polyprenyl-3-methyl-5-hydroxy-6-metoxy-1,4-benzoquinol methylase